jgi:glycosyltransferase involved in cell wall biosynthesis
MDGVVLSSRPIIQASAVYPPYSLGGTEVYLQSLCEELSELGVRNTVLTPRQSGAPARYRHGGADVQTYRVDPAPAPGEMRRDQPHGGFEGFLDLLSASPDGIYHQHTWTRGCGAHHLAAARRRGLRTVLTVHVPGNICLRGTMMEHGVEPCDGRIAAHRCGACWAGGRGAPQLAAQALGALPVSISRLALSSHSRLGSALGARALASDMQGSLQQMFRNADVIVAVCQWLFDALLANGAPAEKLVLNRQGVARSYLSTPPENRRLHRQGQPLKVLWAGRWNSVKGVDILVQAFRRLPQEMPVELTLRGLGGDAEATAFEAYVRGLAVGDPRIRVLGPLPPEDLLREMGAHDVLAVPSTWLETGPLVVLEAQAAGLFVLGSRRGGITELVSAADGELVEPGNVEAWTQALRGLAECPARLSSPTSAPRTVRTMRDVAGDMAVIYAAL